jgi:hypothetical protein
VVLLAFAESKTVSTTTLGLVFPTVWDQTPHRFGLLYYGLDWSTRMEFQSFITIDIVRFRHGTLLWWFVSHFYVSIFHFCLLPGHWTLGVCLSVSICPALERSLLLAFPTCELGRDLCVESDGI